MGDKGLVSMKNHCLIEWLRDWCGTFGENEDVVFKSGDSLDIKKKQITKTKILENFYGL